MEKAKTSGFFIENILMGAWAIFFIFFPLIISTQTTDAFILPKQILLAVISVLSLLLWGLKIIIEKKNHIRRTPYDLTVILLLGFSFISCLFAVNRYDALITYIPLLLVGLGYFIIVNVIRRQSAIFVLLSSITIGATILALLEIFSFFHIYTLPFAFAQSPTFTPMGSLLEQALLFIFIIPIVGYFSYPFLKGKFDSKILSFSIAFVIISIGFIFTLWQLITIAKPVLLPFETGFQTAFAAISQDEKRIAQGFFFGSGYGTFFTDFTRFKQVSFNSYSDLWYLTFLHSSNFVLELLATTGVLGALAYLFLALKIITKPRKKLSNPIYLSLISIIVISFFLPFSFLEIALFILLLGLFVTTQAHLEGHQFYDIELQLVALKKGLITVETEKKHLQWAFTKIVPAIFVLLFLIISLFVGYYGFNYVLSDLAFQKAVIAANANDGNKTYSEQIKAIQLFPYRDVYYRVFSQTNLALANSFAITKREQLTKDPQAQKTLYSLINQSIESGKNAIFISPQTATNWQNLSGIYKSLVGFGEKADQFALEMNKQAIALDPTNPQEFILLGGIYYQLGEYDNAIREFQTAIQLKPDFPNAYYNLGHALEQKGELQPALMQYETVRTLVAKDLQNTAKINKEISALQAKINDKESNKEIQEKEPKPTPSISITTSKKTSELPLDINTGEASLGEQDNKINILNPTQKPTIKP